MSLERVVHVRGGVHSDVSVQRSKLRPLNVRAVTRGKERRKERRKMAVCIAAVHFSNGCGRWVGGGECVGVDGVEL